MASVYDVAAQDFAERVLERSRTIPVLVDFWAEWCGPCRMLGPVLEKVAKDLAGTFELVKLDTEANPDLARRYRIQSIPAVKLFVDGEVKAEFVGALPERAVREFVTTHCPSEADKLAASGLALVDAGETERGADALRAALALDAAHAGAHLALARLALQAGRLDELAAHLAKIPPLAKEADAAASLKAAADLARACQEAGGEEACRAAVARAAGDLDARFALGACLVAKGQYREALDELLAVVAKDRRHRDEGARKAMLTVFGIVGVRSELANEYRRKLAIYL